jgi:predicted dehydrogenase
MVEQPRKLFISWCILTNVLDIGIVGLDTSHPKAFADRLDSHGGTTVSAVWDGGAVRTTEHTNEFCERFEATQYDEPTGMCDAVDAAMVLTANWDTHCSLAVPFLETGIPTLIDKPLSGRLTDVEAIADAANGTSLFGGSAVPFHPSIAELPVDRRERTLYCAGYNDPFYYGVHIVDAARLLAGADWRAVTSGDGPGIVVTIDFENDTRAVCRLDGATENAAFGVLDVANQTRARQVSGDEQTLSVIYDRFIEAFLRAVHGERDDSERLIDGARLLLAVRAALETDSRITPTSPALRRVSADGDAFLANYEPYY